ncbi:MULTISPECIES: carbohydrate ABC transporter permease [Oceanobacillus]|uniref:Sugar ABC transporter permease n=1 Tax=Oceanobacillus kimchii TaxID=746691 RepID=A0ABQ5TQU6_9BACI|nr:MULTISPECIES: carbohydrate ABC transporter permease [Oceanobacillus]MBT2600505.1 carbohydrate ABC transporter permease [Oceanobacillus sp. ISL-74]MBT2650663.1 carbohydrate ABC transporter permease [Oceanobacillus sp. ISL-73]MCT1578416.1 carbohydrate ABC transporter permease [Oceanobacillus kimchii]MCT2134594.1 carbohydrate ABC transporter permease [Oceanobacillus kimchii]GLO67555.1 sugar ABC transporter permease [Oceanobacillus kimchii]
MNANSLKRKKMFSSIAELLGVLLVVTFLFFPILWILITSFKSGEDVYSLSLIFEPTLDNFRAIFNTENNFGKYYMNSIIVVFFTLIITLPVSVLAAYSISRYKIPGKALLMFAILATQFIPLIVNVIPFFSAFRNWGLLDTTIALIIVNLGHTIPYAIWLIKGFMDSIPIDMEEAGSIDGASRLRILWNIVLPIAKPGIITATVFCFVVVWNEFMFALILTSREAITLPVALSYFIGENGVVWNEMAAAGVIYVIPTIIFMLIVRKEFVKGMSAGAIK